MDSTLEAISELAGVPAEFAKSLAKQIEHDGEFSTDVVPDGAFGAVIGKYVIRRDDLNALEELANSVETAASIGFFAVAVPAHALLAAKIGITISLLKIVLRLRNRGAILDEEELQALLFVKSADSDKGVTADVVAKCLEWSIEKANATLNKLSKYPAGDGSSKAFVEQYQLGWRATV